jgi:xylono-1,5-lactonase
MAKGSEKMTIETLAYGYGLAEGPRVGDGGLYFCDSGEGGVFHVDEDGKVAEILPVGRLVGGIALHAEGGIVVSSRDVIHVRDGVERQVFSADLEGARQGDWVPWINDIFTDVQGRVYAGAIWRIYTRAAAAPGQFTIPTGGQGEAYREDKPLGRLWRIDADTAAVPLYGGVGIANGIGVSPDGRLLYQVDSIDQRVIVNEMTDDGLRSRPPISTAAVAGFPDGMAVDSEGRIWTAMFGGGCVACFTPEGALDQVLEVPAYSVTSLCFGGEDWRDMYIVSADNTDDPARRGSVFRTSVDVAGVPVAPARV